MTCLLPCTCCDGGHGPAASVGGIGLLRLRGCERTRSRTWSARPPRGSPAPRVAFVEPEELAAPAAHSGQVYRKHARKAYAARKTRKLPTYFQVTDSDLDLEIFMRPFLLLKHKALNRPKMRKLLDLRHRKKNSILLNQMFTLIPDLGTEFR